MKVYCLYGVGKPTERAYVYHASGADVAAGGAAATAPPSGADSSCTDGQQCAKAAADAGARRQTAWLHDKVREAPPHVASGMVKVDGDGSVPLLSLGYMCVDGWQRPHFNPAGIQVRTREFRHEPVSFMIDPRGGPTTADHVDIMGNHDLITDIVRVATGEELEDRVHSDIRAMAARVPLPDTIG